MEPVNNYLRIGTSYYKLSRKPLASGDFIVTMLPWSIECIKQDHGKDFLATIPRYDGFCFVPSHFNYQKNVGNFYNRYHPFAHEAKEGHPEKTLSFLNHIFGEHIELGLDYLKLLLEQPTQMLPILCLVSKERNTGKTTFLNYMKALFGDNMTINSNEDFRSNFNAEWAHKLLIGVDETFLDRKEDSERIKSLSTSKYYKIESKGVDRQEIEFFGKFILCSNNEDNFIVIDSGETRYWIRKIPVLQEDNRNLLQELKNEIPHLLYFLFHRHLFTIKLSRMWFSPQQICTPSLKKVIKQNCNRLENEIAEVLLMLIDAKELDEIKFCVHDVQDWLAKKGIRNNDSLAIKRILQSHWNLKPANNSNSYTQYRLGFEGAIYDTQQKGRYYQLSKDAILKLNED